MTGFQLVERAPKRLSFVGADPFDEVHQRRLSVSGIRGLIQRVDHQSRDEFVAPVYRRILMRAVVADLRDEILLG